LDLKNSISLCKECRIRQGFIDRRNLKEANECFICNNLMSKLETINNALVSRMGEGYEFRTFQIGVSLPSSYIEREDNIRSRLRLKGRNSIKNQFLSNLREMLKHALNKEMDYISPDLRIDLIINENNEFFFNIIPTPIVLACKYLKKRRGIPQKHKGLAITKDQLLDNDSQYDNSFSLEEVVSGYLKQLTSGANVKFSWIGGEDKESLVLGKGRPFFAEIIKPKRRIITEHNINMKEKGIELFVLSASKNLPRYPMKFDSMTRVSIIAERLVSNKELECLPSLSGRTVWFRNKKRIIRRDVHSVKVGKIDGKSFDLEINAEGGLHIKQFVGGKEYCEPNVSTMLGVRCECLNFDIMDVWLRDQHALEVFQRPSSIKMSVNEKA
jgi:tRNA pseudouridine synthase 10